MIYDIINKKGVDYHMLVRSDRKWDYALGMIKVDGLEPSTENERVNRAGKAR